MNDRHIEKIIQAAEKQAGAPSFIGARLVGSFSLLITGFGVFSESLLMLGIAGICGLVTGSLWSDGRKFKVDLQKSRARTVWQEIGHSSVLSEDSSLKERELWKNIERVYQRDPQGEVLPLPQAIRLTLTWKQQQKRLKTIETHIEQLRVARTTLQEKQKLLRELGDDNSGLERALAQLEGDISPLEHSYNVLRASCTRLESLVVEVEATVRRRELHREVGDLTAHLSSGKPSVDDPFEAGDEHLDLERQIGREIETFLRLERETDAHLRDS